jgi:hypothetical protein
MIIMQGIAYGMPEQSILVSQFSQKDHPEVEAVFEIAQDGNQIMVNGETIKALYTALNEMLKRSREEPPCPSK